MTKISCVYMGTPQFSIPTLEALRLSEFVDLVAVVTMPDRPAGRGKQLQSPAVAEYAKLHNIKLFQEANINKSQEFLSFCEQSRPDVFIVLSFAQFLSQKTLDIPRLGCFNIHTSLLPKYRGAAPIHYALKNGDLETGVSIQKMVKKMDAGDLCLSLPVEISKNDDIVSLSNKLSLLSAECMPSFLEQLVTSKLKFTAQDENQVSIAPEIGKEEGFVDFQKQSALQIINLYRAFKLWPSLFYYHQGLRYKIAEMALSVCSGSTLPPGIVDLNSGRMLIGTVEGVVEILQIQPEGKKAISIKDYMNGLKSKGLNLKFAIEG
ncbi:MAG: methionyl-tRNA formyltransferase [Bdellovibrio sp. CG12_big_fil_rev_8_21_14_0_65_39_13]|nr:MAG: methionyl-tRNA formyltransferase [Bdellovibrio sp. CG22_combo_CG10-13_8_21_14_all_39_27]PIQ60719.1 MAG: methionyl-tRNA formyltransferase [Bdellovibrio sp. CG12_big_fil_rev_8_21_14_0_65_39_13]PIR36343.1 MAG: methionyl-tRNA formyltransferase [Bdellovibrio sp. CG11_big_fil_rev_8_21_14_0_20_39_38]